MATRISKRGGTRPGSGRPAGSGKSREPTQVIRVPAGAKAPVLDFITAYNERKQNEVSEAPPFPEDALFPALAPPKFDLPLYAYAVPAGLPAEATDDVDRRIDLNEFLIRNPVATFYFKVTGDSMNRTIHDGSVAAVDCSRLPQNNDVVLAVVEGDFTLKRYVKKGRKFELQPDSTNPRHQPIIPGAEQTIEIRGVIVGVIQKFH